MKTRFSIPEMGRFLRDAYGPFPHLSQMEEGDESQAFSASVDGRDLVVRAASTRDGFDKDRLVASRWPTTLAPIVLDILPIGDGWACISEKAPGRTLQSLGTATREIAPAVCAMMDVIAASDISPVTGYGAFSAQGKAGFSSWRDFILSIEGPPQWLALLEAFDYGAPHGLVHGDFGSNNVLVADGRISAVLDWSEAMTGDPAYDLANLFFWRPWLDCMEAQCSYIEVNEPYRSADAARLLRYQLRIGLQIRAEAQADADTRLVEWATHRCATIAAALNGPQEQGSAHRA